MHPSIAFGALVANSTTCDVASTYWTGIHHPTSVGALGGPGLVVVVAAL